MSVRLIVNGRGSECKLYGQPFPPDDVKAYWSMVPDHIIVEWSQAFGLFCVSRTIDNIIATGNILDGEPAQPARRLQVMAKDAMQLSTWMRVISELCCGK